MEIMGKTVEILTDSSVIKTPLLIVKRKLTERVKWSWKPLSRDIFEALPVFVALHQRLGGQLYQIAVIDKGEYPLFRFHPELQRFFGGVIKRRLKPKVYRVGVINNKEIFFEGKNLQIIKKPLNFTVQIFTDSKPPITLFPKNPTDQKRFIQLFGYTPQRLPEIGFDPVEVDVKLEGTEKG